MEKRFQKKITLSKEEVEKVIKLRQERKPIVTISKLLQVPFNKVHNNMRLLGLVQERKKRVKNNDNIYFNVDTFGRQYRW